jgi:hypothetical protein
MPFAEEKSKSPASHLLQAVAIHRPIGLQVYHRGLNSQRLDRTPSANRSYLTHCIRSPDACSRLYNLLFRPTQDKYSKIKDKENNIVLTNTPKHNSKVTGMVAKADKGSLRHPQKIFLFLLPENQKVKTKRVFFGLPLHLWPPTCDRKGIMFRCIVRCKLGSWWLLIYVYRVAGIKCYFLRNIGWYYIKLSWLSLSISKLPF